VGCEVKCWQKHVCCSDSVFAAGEETGVATCPPYTTRSRPDSFLPLFLACSRWPSYWRTNTMSKDAATLPAEDEPPVQVFDTTAAGDSATSETGKLKMIVDLIRRSMGIKDLATMYVPACTCCANCSPPRPFRR